MTSHPSNRLFIRNNGLPPPEVDPASWTLSLDGESVTRETSYTIGELREKFEVIDRQLVLECGGNGRSEFNPPVSGNQWTLGAVGCPQWNGVRLKGRTRGLRIQTRCGLRRFLCC